jgi:hypothetical protein
VLFGQPDAPKLEVQPVKSDFGLWGTKSAVYFPSIHWGISSRWDRNLHGMYNNSYTFNLLLWQYVIIDKNPKNQHTVLIL